MVRYSLLKNTSSILILLWYAEKYTLKAKNPSSILIVYQKIQADY